MKFTSLFVGLIQLLLIPQVIAAFGFNNKRSNRIHLDINWDFFNGTVSNTTKLTSRQFEQNDVILPITFPSAGANMEVGALSHIDWDPSQIQPGIKPTGKIVLGIMDPATGSPNGHLNLRQAMSLGLDFRTGNSFWVVPGVPERHDYVLVILIDGVDGFRNVGPQFGIVPVNTATFTDTFLIPNTSPTLTAFTDFIAQPTTKAAATTTSSQGNQSTGNGNANSVGSSRNQAMPSQTLSQTSNSNNSPETSGGTAATTEVSQSLSTKSPSFTDTGKSSGTASGTTTGTAAKVSIEPTEALPPGATFLHGQFADQNEAFSVHCLQGAVLWAVEMFLFTYLILL